MLALIRTSYEPEWKHAHADVANFVAPDGLAFIVTAEHVIVA